MENEKFVIECRYESFTKNGKKFNNWFVQYSTPISESEGNTKIKELKRNYKYIDDKTHLAHEYRLRPYNEYISEIENLKVRIKEADKKQKLYLASDEYKELQKKKRQTAKERKERQKKYIEEHLTDEI